MDLPCCFQSLALLACILGCDMSKRGERLCTWITGFCIHKSAKISIWRIPPTLHFYSFLFLFLQSISQVGLGFVHFLCLHPKRGISEAEDCEAVHFSQSPTTPGRGCSLWCGNIQIQLPSSPEPETIHHPRPNPKSQNLSSCLSRHNHRISTFLVTFPSLPRFEHELP